MAPFEQPIRPGLRTARWAISFTVIDFSQIVL